MKKDAYNPARVIGAARRMLADAQVRCQTPDRLSEENIHEVRKHLKAVRAYWWLIRDAAGDAAIKSGNTRCSRAAKHLSLARDQAVMHATLEALSHKAGPDDRSAIDRAKVVIGAGDDPSGTQRIDWPAVIDLLREDESAWAGLDASAIKPVSIRRGRKRTQRKAKRCYRSAKATAKAELMHAWRAWVKRVYAQERLLHPDRTSRLKRLDRLGDLLGLHHDLSVLWQRLAADGPSSDEDRRRINALIAARQAKLAAKTLRLGKKLF